MVEGQNHAGLETVWSSQREVSSVAVKGARGGRGHASIREARKQSHHGRIDDLHVDAFGIHPFKARAGVVSTSMVFAQCAKHRPATRAGADEGSAGERLPSNHVVHGPNY